MRAAKGITAQPGGFFLCDCGARFLAHVPKQTTSELQNAMVSFLRKHGDCSKGATK